MLEQVINELADKICSKRGFRTPYQLIVKPELPMDAHGNERIVIIKAGNPPVICISRIYIEACFSEKFAGPRLRDTLERALEFAPKMYHTLALVPIADAVALRKDLKRWKRANIPNLNTVIDDRFFEITYSVTVKDTVTQTSITRNGSDVNEILKEAKYSLSRMIIQDEEMQEYRERLEEERKVKELEVKPNEVSLSIGDGVHETRMEY